MKHLSKSSPTSKPHTIRRIKTWSSGRRRRRMRWWKVLRKFSRFLYRRSNWSSRFPCQALETTRMLRSRLRRLILAPLSPHKDKKEGP